MQEATIIQDAPKSGKSPKTAKSKSTPAPAEKNSGRGLAVAALIISILSAFCSLVLVFLLCGLIVTLPFFDEPTSFVSEFADGNSANFTEGSIADVANRVSPSVVSIVTETKTTKTYINWFMGGTYDEDETGAAAGTGIIVSDDGYVLTNKHVIENATKIYVVLDDGTVYKDVELKATDPLNDVAYLQINNASGLTPATLGDSKTISLGEQVIAIGNALGQYQNSVTAGIVSGTGRSLTATDESSQNAESLTDMIQTDAAINSGNSGGPLVNAAGEVIGINTAVSSANSIGFAIPISAVKGMLKSLIETGEAKRAFAGIKYNNIDVTTALENNLASTYGAYVGGIISGSPAESAGLKAGDIILAVDDYKIGANSSLGTLLGEHTVGDTVKLTVLRGDTEKTLELTLAEYAE